MAIAQVNRLVRNSKVDLCSLTSSAPAYTGIAPSSVGFGTTNTSTDMIQWRAISTMGSTISSAQAGSTVLNMPFEEDGLVAFLVSWACTDVGEVESRTASLTIKAGDSRGAWQSGLGDVTISFLGTGDTGPRLERKFIGPFEGARFAKVLTSAGSSAASGVKPGNRFIQMVPSLATSGGAGAYFNVIPFLMPSVQYDT